LLKDCDVEELAKRLDSERDWRRIADQLGLTDNEKREIEAKADTVVDHIPTVEVLRLWSAKKRSRVRFLRQILIDEGLDELVKQLDHLRMSKYTDNVY